MNILRFIIEFFKKLFSLFSPKKISFELPPWDEQTLTKKDINQMGVTYGFYNSVAEDRKYNAVQISKMFDGLILDGVFSAFGGSLLVSANTGMNVQVASGRAWFNGTWTYNDAALVLAIGAPHAQFPRIDAVILEVNADDAVRANSIKVVAGTPATVPVPPTLTNSGTLHQYPLAHVYVAVGASSILGGDITNKVGTTDCPFVTNPLEHLDASALMAEWEAEFENWFNFIMTELDEGVAGNLQNQILNHTHTGTTDGTILTPSGVANRTRKFLITSSSEPLNGSTMVQNNINSTVYGNFYLPVDFVSDLVITPIIRTFTTIPGQQAYIAAGASAGALNEDYDTHYPAGLAWGAYTMIANKLQTPGSYTFPQVSAGDFVEVNFSRQGGHVLDTYNDNLLLLGWLIEYTADS